MMELEALATAVQPLENVIAVNKYSALYFEGETKNILKKIEVLPYQTIEILSDIAVRVSTKGAQL